MRRRWRAELRRGGCAPDDELRALLQTLISRLMKLLTRRDVLVDEAGQTCLAEPDAHGNEARTLRRLQAAAVTYRVAFGPPRRVLTLRVWVHLLREQDPADELSLGDAVKRLMRFIGSRPLVGYYLEFDVSMLYRAIRPLLGIDLPQPAIEVPGLYYDYKLAQQPSHRQHGVPFIDLHFAVMMEDLGLPLNVAHETLSEAVQAALAFVKLRHLRTGA